LRCQQRVAAGGNRLRGLFEFNQFVTAEFLGKALAGHNMRTQIAK
jgi:hypothetical protein